MEDELRPQSGDRIVVSDHHPDVCYRGALGAIVRTPMCVGWYFPIEVTLDSGRRINLYPGEYQLLSD